MDRAGDPHPPRPGTGTDEGRVPLHLDLGETQPRMTVRRTAAKRAWWQRERREDRALALAASLALLLAIGWLDHATGPSVPMAIAYVLPVALTAWFLGVMAGSAAALLASMASLAASWPSGPADAPDAYWSAALRLAILLVVATATALAHRRIDHARAIADVELERADRMSMEQQRYEVLFHAVAHDARAPLTTILGMALTLLRTAGSITPGERDLLRRIATNAERLNKLLDDLLTHGRTQDLTLTSGNSGSLSLLARRVIRDLPALEDRQVTLDVCDDAWAVDGTVAERMLENLLLNAAVHTPHHARIWVRAWRDERAIVLAVEDDGPGVPSEERGAIFLPHERGQATGPGYGLGLSMIATFADLYGGRAWVEDRPGGGASFRVLLPLADTHTTRTVPAGQRSPGR